MSRRYLDASSAIEAVQCKRTSINTYFNKHPKQVSTSYDWMMDNASITQVAEGAHQKAVYALVCETIKHEKLLRELYHAIGVSLEEVDARPALVLVMTYELLLGKGKIEVPVIGAIVILSALVHSALLMMQMGVLWSRAVAR